MMSARVVSGMASQESLLGYNSSLPTSVCSDSVIVIPLVQVWKRGAENFRSLVHALSG
jgi:hypothetical protein